MIDEAILKNKNCFISGAAGGLGECFTRKMAKEGANLFLTDVNETKLEKIKNDIESSGAGKIKIFYAFGNFEKLDDIYKIMDTAKNTIGNIDILINCIGINQAKPFIESTIEEYEKMMDINVRVPYVLCSTFCKDMIKNNWGRIINLGSTTSYEVAPSVPLYSISKHAVLGLNRILSKDFSKYNVRSICISPAAFQSDMGRDVVRRGKAIWEDLLDPEEIVDYATYAMKLNSTMISDEIRLNMLPK